MIKKIKYLLPIYRTLAGSGTRKTLNFFEKNNNNFKRLKFKTNQKVFDWKIPYEWEIKNSFIQNLKTKFNIIIEREVVLENAAKRGFLNEEIIYSTD